MENPINMDDLGVPLFLETPKCQQQNYLNSSGSQNTVECFGGQPCIPKFPATISCTPQVLLKASNCTQPKTILDVQKIKKSRSPNKNTHRNIYGNKKSFVKKHPHPHTKKKAMVQKSILRTAHPQNFPRISQPFWHVTTCFFRFSFIL